MALPNVVLLERELNARGWNQRDLATAAGVSESLISKIFSGGSARPNSLQRIVRALEVQPVDPGLQVLLDTAVRIQDPVTAAVVTGSKEPKRGTDAGLSKSP